MCLFVCLLVGLFVCLLYFSVRLVVESSILILLLLLFVFVGAVDWYQNVQGPCFLAR